MAKTEETPSKRVRRLARVPQKNPAKTPPRKYTDKQKAQIVERAQAIGLAPTHEETGIPKSTIKGWLTKAGVKPGGVTEATAEHARQAAIASTERRRQLRAEAMERTTDSLAAIAQVSASNELGILRGNRPSFRDPESGLVTSMAEDVRLHEVVGSRTRAIHDLALLEGKVTERRGINVTFNMPRPDPQTTIVIPQAELGMGPIPTDE